jgi:hypothetical protein
LGDALTSAADRLIQEAERIKREATRYHARASVAEEWAYLPAWIERIAHHAERGTPSAETAADIAAIHHVRADWLLYHYNAHQAGTATAIKWRRDRYIMQRAWAGDTNAEIAAKVKLSAKSVSRIIAGRLRGKERAPYRAATLDGPAPAQLASPDRD